MFLSLKQVDNLGRFRLVRSLAVSAKNTVLCYLFWPFLLEVWRVFSFQENLSKLQKMFSRNWEFIFMQAEAQAKWVWVTLISILNTPPPQFIV